MMNCVMVRWLCDRRVVFDIRVLKVYNFTFLLVLTAEMTPKKKMWKWKEVQDIPAV